MGLRAHLEAVEKRKISYTCWESNTNVSAVWPVAYRYADWAVPALRVDGIIWIKESEHGGVGWIDLAPERFQTLDHVNIRVP
jgi:hypothetical protein